MSNNKEIILPKGKIKGGANLPHCKNTAEYSSVIMPSPKTVTIPMVQHIGAPCEPTVKVGDEVFVGSLIGDSQKAVSSPVYSSVSGTVKTIGELCLANGSICKTVIIESNGKDEADPTLKPYDITCLDELVEATRRCGLVGLGGAGFPTHVKLAPRENHVLDTLIINGAECEPFITSDYRCCMENYDDIIEGVYLLKEIIGFEQVIIAIEDNKPAAIQKLTELAADHRDTNNSVRVLKLKSHYPQGAEKVLIYTATGRRLPLGALPSDVGCMVLNITSVATLYNFFKTGMPLTKKRITVDGSAIKNPQNVIVPIGTSVADLIEFCGGFKDEPVKVLYGGPMMGVTLYDLSQPIIKQNNAILAFAEENPLIEATVCINCGRCHRACPMNLMPCEVQRILDKSDNTALNKLFINYCIECGSCAWSCPAHRPLTQVMRLAKSKIRGGK